MGRWIFLFAASLAASFSANLDATSLYWNSASAAPGTLALDQVYGVNNSGAAVGSAGGQAAETSIYSQILVTLGLPSGYSFGAAINDSGQIAGNWVNAQGYQQAFFWSQATGVVEVGTLGGAMSISLAINGSGQIVGQSFNGSDDLAAFGWSLNTGIKPIGDSDSESAVAITNSGQVAYQEDPYPYQTQYGAIGDINDPSILNFNGNGSVISGMNNQGWLVGESGGQGFLWTANGSWNFGSWFLPAGVNDSGEVVGSYQGQPAIWTQSGGIQLLDLGGYSNVYLTGINDNGQIVGDASIPEPSAPALCLIGVVLMAAGWRRRRMVSACQAQPYEIRGHDNDDHARP